MDGPEEVDQLMAGARRESTKKRTLDSVEEVSGWLPEPRIKGRDIDPIIPNKCLSLSFAVPKLFCGKPFHLRWRKAF